MENTILEMHQISKSFPGVKALSHVNLSVRKGEVHAIIGENGAGKSTLMKVLGGVYQPDEGEILINGRKVEIASPSESIAHKIGIIYQEFNLVQTLDVAENIFLGHEICDRMKFMSSREMHQRAQEVMTKLGINHFDCRRKIRDLSVAMQQLVEIAKAMFYEINILVMDEPTAVLTDRETQGLFKMISSLKDKGISIIYISHRLEEIVQIADSITILRDGCNVEVVDNRNHDVDKEYLVSRMVGRKLENYYPEKTVGVSGEVRLEVKNLSHKGIFEDISFQVHKGEILGFSGLVGAGRSEIMKTVFGAMQKDSGTVLIDGKTVNIKSPEDARNHGLSLAPENRKLEGLNIGMSIEDNITLASHNEISRAGFFIESRKRNMARKYVDELQVHPAELGREVKNLSGGNQQKVVVGKWLATNPKVIILDEPTRGIDVGAKAEMYEIINKLTQRGLAVIVVSSELQELIGICDRIIVIREGRISGEFAKSDFNQDKIMRAASIYEEANT